MCKTFKVVFQDLNSSEQSKALYSTQLLLIYFAGQVQCVDWNIFLCILWWVHMLSSHMLSTALQKGQNQKIHRKARGTHFEKNELN